jgi:transposase
MKKELLASGVVQSDDTTVKYLERPGPAKKGYLWAYVSLEGDVVYDFTRSRSRDGPTGFLAGFEGTLQVDGYAGYNEIFATEGIKHAACWAHVRRKFENALASAPAEAAVLMQAIQTLYRVEKELRQDLRPGHDEIRQVRQAQSKPVVEKLKEILVAYREQALPKSALGRAIEYAFGQWEWLQTYLADGRVDIDNNSCERAMRRVAVGRKNCLFAGSEKGGTNSAVLYTIIETCVRNKINPHEYLTDVLVRVGTHPQSRVAQLTPRGWAKMKLEAGV